MNDDETLIAKTAVRCFRDVMRFSARGLKQSGTAEKVIIDGVDVWVQVTTEPMLMDVFGEVGESEE